MPTPNSTVLAILYRFTAFCSWQLTVQQMKANIQRETTESSELHFHASDQVENKQKTLILK